MTMTDMIDGETGEVTTVSYRRSTLLNELFAALAKAQGEFTSAAREGSNPHFKSKYATLDSVREATRKACADNGLCVMQPPTNGDGQTIAVTTILGHSSGQWIESTLAMAPTKWDAQGAGSVITYLRRYALMSMLGIAPEDDDGEAAVQAPDRSARPAPAPQRNGHSVTPAVKKQTDDAKRAHDAWYRIRDEINKAVDLKELNKKGIKSPQKDADEQLIRAQQSGDLAWQKLVDYDAQKRQKFEEEEQQLEQDLNMLEAEETEDVLR